MKYTKRLVYSACLLVLISFGYYTSYYLPSLPEKQVLETEQSMQTDFYLFDEEGIVMVRLQDGTLYEATEIPVSQLPGKIKEQLTDGYKIRGKKELYEFLENYSS